VVGSCQMRESPCTNMVKFSTFSESFYYLFSARVTRLTIRIVSSSGMASQLAIQIHDPFDSLMESTA